MMLLLAKICTVHAPILLKHAVDALDTRIAPEIIIPFALLFAYGGLRILSVIFQELREILFIKVAQYAIRQTSLNVFRHLHRLSLRFHLERQTGGITNVIERGARSMDFLLTFMLFNIIPTIVELMLVGAILWGFFDFSYALATIGTIVVYVVFTLLLTEWRVKYRREINEQQRIASSKTVESLLNYETVKYFSKENFEAERLKVNLLNAEKAQFLSTSSLSLVNIGQSAIIATGLIGLLIMAAYDYNASKLTLGDFVLVNSYLLQLYIPLNFLGFVYRQIRQSLIDIEDMFVLLKQNSDISDADNANDIDVKKGHIIFDQIHFAYDERRKVLQNFSLDIPALSSVAIVGASGCGKSTISRLLFRFYETNQGCITIDGHDIQYVTQESLRRAIGIVPQDTVLFNDSIYYNIAYGALGDATQSDIEHVAKLAQIHDFIISLPDGYDTVVGERGLKLSGGEKQRVAIARMLLKKPKNYGF